MNAPEVEGQESADTALFEIQYKVVRWQAAGGPAALHRRPALARQVVAAKDGLVKLVVAQVRQRQLKRVQAWRELWTRRLQAQTSVASCVCLGVWLRYEF